MLSMRDSLAAWKPGRLRVLVVGAGISGLTLSALLRRQGIDPLVIERAANFEAAGYSIGLYPIGSRVLHGLGVFDDFMRVSVDYDSYQLHSGTGEPIKSYDMRGIFDRIGPFRGLRRAEMLEVLRTALGDLPIYFEQAPAAIAQDPGGVAVTFGDGAQAHFDLVVGADGIHSWTRQQVLAPEEYAKFDTGWGAWVLWTTEPLAAPGETREYWGAGSFLGIYPVRDALMLCVGGPKAAISDTSLGAPVDRFRRIFQGMDAHLVDVVASLLVADANPFFWDLHDYRSRRWSAGRVVLCGDAAAAFLPTAGIGASMAMNAAASLADELSRSDATHLTLALDAYVARQKARTEKAQTLSRELGKFMLVENRPLAWARDHLAKMYTTEQFARDTLKLMESEVS